MTNSNNAGVNPAQPITQMASENPAMIKRIQEETINKVITKIEQMKEADELILPAGYNAKNALKAAWLHLQGLEMRDKRLVIDVCTKESICNSLLKMVLFGETVILNHGYFIPTGNKLTYWEDYRGKLMRAKRDTEIERVNAQVIYEKDVFVYTVDENAEYQLVKHETALENIDLNKIKGAYAVVTHKDGSKRIEVMTIEQIKASWQQGAANGNSPAHKNFTDQMCKKTLIARACKIALSSSVDADNNVNDDLGLIVPDQTTALRDEAQTGLFPDLVIPHEISAAGTETINVSECEFITEADKKESVKVDIIEHDKIDIGLFKKEKLICPV